MKKTIIASIFLIYLLFSFVASVQAQAPPVPPAAAPTLQPCPVFSCPVVKDPNGGPDTKVFCDEANGDKWVYDAEITALGKGGDRARQFIFWTINTTSLDTSSGIRAVWSTSRNIVYFLLVIVAIFMGLGIIVGQRNNFDFKVKIWPLILKLAMLLLYVSFSYVVVVLIVQLSDILMQFFIKGLGGDKIFNIFFNGINNEQNYRTFVGCSNANPNALESVRTSKFLIKITNITYYALAIMMILRKIVLWFLITVAPFLALLAPFVFIRNTGMIWIGVFFQWVFYGPLFGLFLGGLAKIWNSPTHIPFQFVFSRTNKLAEIVYPTAINILYSGPSQKPQVLNSSNYVDTFAEYVISLIMLWTALLLPWLLLRIFRDYCCDGIYAMKNILLSMYDNMQSNPPSGPNPNPVSPRSTIDSGSSMRMHQEKEVVSKIKMETIEDIKKAKTEDIRSSVHLTATKLTDIARFETNKQYNETVKKNIEYLQNPLKAQTPTERQKFMTMRTELFDRATKGDKEARQTLAAISTSKFEQTTQKQKILETIPQAAPSVSVIQTMSVSAGLPQEKTASIVKNIYSNITNNSTVVNNIAQESNTTSHQTQQVLSAVTNTENINKQATQFAPSIAKQTGVSEEKVRAILTTTSHVFKTQKDIVKQVALKENVNETVVQKIVDQHAPAISAPEVKIEDSVIIPPTVSIEDYEEVKTMWAEQYEKGEIPVTENITDRKQWVETDVVAITNILNKIMSSDPVLKAQGLEDVSYILPIFMVNNLKGEELMVYLKAKLEAAKQVKKDLDRETEIMDKLKSKEEEVLVDVNTPQKKEEEKHLEASEELPEPPVAGQPQTPLNRDTKAEEKPVI